MVFLGWWSYDGRICKTKSGKVGRFIVYQGLNFIDRWMESMVHRLWAISWLQLNLVFRSNSLKLARWHLVHYLRTDYLRTEAISYALSSKSVIESPYCRITGIVNWSTLGLKAVLTYVNTDVYRSKSLFTSKLRVFDLDGVTNRSEELLPGVHSPIHQHNTRLTSRGLRYDPNHFRLHKSFWIRDKFDQGVMPPRAYNWYFFMQIMKIFFHSF